VSVEGEDDWRSWCEAEHFSEPKWQTEIHLTGQGRPLLNLTPADIDAFTIEWRKNGWEAWSRRAINWPALTVKYGGIIIAPYSWEHRLKDETSWYYSWDCASGCLWDARTWRAGDVVPVEFHKEFEASEVAA
jgi:hypothetical protein